MKQQPKYWLTLETDDIFNKFNASHLGSIRYETSDLGYSFNNLSKAIQKARDKAIDYSEYEGEKIIGVHSERGIRYVIGCGKKKGLKFPHKTPNQRIKGQL